MKKTMRKMIALLLSVLAFMSLFAAIPANASEQSGVFTVKAVSNLFPAAQTRYTNLAQYEDANGDVYITVEFKMCALGMYLVNLDVDAVRWDPQVLEFKEAYNKTGTGRNAKIYVFPFAVDQGHGTGTVNALNSSEGYIVGNFSAVMPAANAYEEDNTAVTVVRVRFKVLDRTAGETTVNCQMDTIGLCEDTEPEPIGRYYPVKNRELNQEVIQSMTTFATVITPAQQSAVCDFDNSGEVTVQDATFCQRLLAEFDAGVDRSDPAVIAMGDANHDGKLDVRDLTEIQRFLAGIISSL